MFEQIFDAIGNSVFYEEWRGDFARARGLAEEWVRSARSAGEPSTLADALISQGLVRLLQGEILTAFDCFREVEQLVPHDVERSLLAFSFGYLNTCEQFN